MLLTEKQINQPPASFRLPRETIGDLDAETVGRVLAMSSDIAMVVDGEGIIRDLAVCGDNMPADGFDGVLGRRWIDTVTSDSRGKVEDMLQAATGRGESRWREVNQIVAEGSIPFRYMALLAGRQGGVIALGRDLRGVALLQQQIVQVQQEMERGYVRLRQAESRYRVLFQVSSEAVLVVDPASRKIVEANPAAGRLLSVDHAALQGKAFVKLFHEDTREVATALLADPSGSAHGEPVAVRLADGRAGFTASASLFRHDGTAHLLVSLSRTSADLPVLGDDSKVRLLRILNHIPDAFVVTDEALNILDVNLAFLELTQIAHAESAKGTSLSRFIGRPGVDLRVILENLREHGWVRNFGTVSRTVFGEQEEVELSAVSVREGLEAAHGFIVRRVRRAAPVASQNLRSLPRTAEQLTQLVGRISLREIVAETTDVIEQMCIEAALSLTGNNRVNAAEVLGLSRQSLYTKLRRHGLEGQESSSDKEN